MHKDSEPKNYDVYMEALKREDKKSRKRGAEWLRRWNTRLASCRPRPASQPKIGRNDKCPCGSDKKYKKCCLGR